MADKIDVIIIGAGIAGITTAYYLQKNFPDIKYKILDSRSSAGGTWDQMKFPGVRADNDMYTCLLYTSPSPRDAHESRMPSSA